MNYPFNERIWFDFVGQFLQGPYSETVAAAFSAICLAASQSVLLVMGLRRSIRNLLFLGLGFIGVGTSAIVAIRLLHWVVLLSLSGGGVLALTALKRQEWHRTRWWFLVVEVILFAVASSQGLVLILASLLTMGEAPRLGMAIMAVSGLSNGAAIYVVWSIVRLGRPENEEAKHF